MAADPRVVDVLGVSECEAFLRSHHFGRVGLDVAGRPAIIPVNYTFADGRIAIRTDSDSALAGAVQQAMAFEVDEVDEGARTGWSVLVTGVGYDVTDALDETSGDLRHFPVDTWVAGPDARWIRIEGHSITGRRVRPA